MDEHKQHTDKECLRFKAIIEETRGYERGAAFSNKIDLGILDWRRAKVEEGPGFRSRCDFQAVAGVASSDETDYDPMMAALNLAKEPDGTSWYGSTVAQSLASGGRKTGCLAHDGDEPARVAPQDQSPSRTQSKLARFADRWEQPCHRKTSLSSASTWHNLLGLD